MPIEQLIGGKSEEHGTHVRCIGDQETQASGRVEAVLAKGSQQKKEVKSLQHLLHELGFDGPLQWDTYGADGDYGGCTTRAVQGFARQKGIKVTGSKVTPKIADALIKAAEASKKAQEPPPQDKLTNQVKLGTNTLEKGNEGLEVVELQIRLSGFRCTVWDGEYGSGTELQVRTFQPDVMGMEEPTGIADTKTLKALKQFAKTYPLNFKKFKCSCGKCGGFGQGRFANEYREGKPKTEAYHNREYPGIHKAILHSLRAAWFYGEQAEETPFLITCGYRCWINNNQKGRRSTNHMGKALDCDFKPKNDEDKRDDMNRCDRFRGVLVEKGNFQIGWSASNRKALEPSNIAPTWIHMDVRQYSPRYLDERFFVKSAAELDAFEF